jgi:hypothetical protein
MMTGATQQAGLERAEGAARPEELVEIETRLANIVASVREIAASAEEQLREMMAAAPGDAVANTNLRAISHLPFMIEASRLQISALHALMAQGQRLAA